MVRCDGEDGLYNEVKALIKQYSGDKDITGVCFGDRLKCEAKVEKKDDLEVLTIILYQKGKNSLGKALIDDGVGDVRYFFGAVGDTTEELSQVARDFFFRYNAFGSGAIYHFSPEGRYEDDVWESKEYYTPNPEYYLLSGIVIDAISGNLATIKKI